LFCLGLLCCSGEKIENNLAYKICKNWFDKSLDTDFNMPSWAYSLNFFNQLCNRYQKVVIGKLEKNILKRHRRNDNLSSKLLPPISQVTPFLQEILNNKSDIDISQSKNTSIMSTISSTSSTTPSVPKIQSYSSSSTTTPPLPKNSSNYSASTKNVTSGNLSATSLITPYTKSNLNDQSNYCTIHNNSNCVINKMADENKKSSTSEEESKLIFIYLCCGRLNYWLQIIWQYLLLYYLSTPNF